MLCILPKSPDAVLYITPFLMAAMQTDLFISRAENEINAAQVLFLVSNDKEMQKISFRLKKQFTFYSATISHAYYCIFYAAKALLAKEGITTGQPNVHKKTLEAFEKCLVKTGKLDVQLLIIYKEMLIRADTLLDIFSRERGKRGHFTYQKLPEANEAPAEESIRNAKIFFRTASTLLEP